MGPGSSRRGGSAPSPVLAPWTAIRRSPSAAAPLRAFRYNRYLIAQHMIGRASASAPVTPNIAHHMTRTVTHQHDNLEDFTPLSPSLLDSTAPYNGMRM